MWETHKSISYNGGSLNEIRGTSLMFQQAFSLLVVPVLNYGASVWSWFYSQSDLEKVQKQAYGHYFVSQ